MTSIDEVYELFLKSNGVQTDSRILKDGELFFALKGKNFDGNLFVKQAIEKNASGCIVDNYSIARSDKKIYYVKDVLNCLQLLAKKHRCKFNIPVFALTGSNGKTTTKELISKNLSVSHKPLTTKGNYNNHIGVPLTLLRLNKSHTHAIIEMGANKLGEIDFLCSIANPTHGLITNIGKAHLEGFKSIEGVLKGKTELYKYIKKNKGYIFLNSENFKLVEASKGTKIIEYSKKDLKKSDHKTKICVHYKKNIIQTNLFGDYNIENIVASICVAKFFGVSDDDIVIGISNYIPLNNRSQIITRGEQILIMDAYNANPSSMKKALSSLKTKVGDKTLIIGEMAELGDDKQKEHLKLVDEINKMNFSSTFWVGPSFKNIVIQNWFENSLSLKKYLSNNKILTKFIFLKGSRSSKLEEIIDVL